MKRSSIVRLLAAGFVGFVSGFIFCACNVSKSKSSHNNSYPTVTASCAGQDLPLYAAQEFLFESYDLAKEVLDEMEEIVDEYGNITIADYYEICSITPNYTETLYGWTGSEVEKIKLVEIEGGCIHQLPIAHRL